MHFENYQIRQLEITDLKNYFELIERNRIRLENFFTGTTDTILRTRSFEETAIFLKDLIKKREDKTYFPFIVVHNNSDEIISYIDLKNLDWSIPKAEVGCYTDENYAGLGITAKAFPIFVDYCFEHYCLKKVFIRTHFSNKPAQRFVEKCGFKIEGKIRRDYKTPSGDVVDLVYYGKLS